MKLSFSIHQKAYWTSEPNETEVALPFFSEGDLDVSFIPPIVRRRLPLIAKAMVSLDHQLASERMAAVYASQYAEMSNTMDLIGQFTDDLSPSKFSMSVNNALPGLISVISKNQLPYTVIDSLDGLVESAVIEAMTLLNEYDQVKVVLFEEKTAAPFQELGVQQRDSVLVLLVSQGDQYQLRATEPNINQSSNLHAPEINDTFLQFLAGKSSTFERAKTRKVWHWSKQ